VNRSRVSSRRRILSSSGQSVANSPAAVIRCLGRRSIIRSHSQEVTPPSLAARRHLALGGEEIPRFPQRPLARMGCPSAAAALISLLFSLYFRAFVQS
jgi:hypothetical protein